MPPWPRRTESFIMFRRRTKVTPARGIIATGAYRLRRLIFLTHEKNVCLSGRYDAPMRVQGRGSAGSSWCAPPLAPRQRVPILDNRRRGAACLTVLSYACRAGGRPGSVRLLWRNRTRRCGWRAQGRVGRRAPVQGASVTTASRLPAMAAAVGSTRVGLPRRIRSISRAVWTSSSPGCWGSNHPVMT